MATAKKAPAKKPAAKKTTAKKAPAKKATAKKAAPKKSQNFDFKASADKAVNIYLGVIGKGIDAVQENLESARKDNEKRMNEFEKRGAKLRKELTKQVEDFEVSDVVEDAKEQFNKFQDDAKEQLEKIQGDAKEQFSKIQDQVEDAVESAKEKLNKAA